MSNFEKYKISDTEANAVKIANSADRPNAFNSYTAGKKTAADVKAMFDAPFLLVKRKYNELVSELGNFEFSVSNELERLDKKISGYKYELTEEDIAEIAGIVLAQAVNGDGVKY